MVGIVADWDVDVEAALDDVAVVVATVPPWVAPAYVTAASQPKPLVAATPSTAVPMVKMRSRARFRDRASRAVLIEFMNRMVEAEAFRLDDAHHETSLIIGPGMMLAGALIAPLRGCHARPGETGRRLAAYGSLSSVPMDRRQPAMHFGRASLAPLLVVGIVAACSSSASTPSPPAASAAPAASMSAAPSAASTAPVASSSEATSGGGYGGYSRGSSSSSPAAAAGGLALTKVSLGTVLTGPNGHTLYELMSDTSTTSTCTGSCAGNWPPLTGDLPSLGAGLTASDFASLTRSDGTKQITFHGHPVYYFAGDQSAGDTNGQGLAGKWYVVGADGNPIK